MTEPPRLKNAGICGLHLAFRIGLTYMRNWQITKHGLDTPLLKNAVVAIYPQYCHLREFEVILRRWAKKDYVCHDVCVYRLLLAEKKYVQKTRCAE